MVPVLKGVALGIGAGTLLYVVFVLSRFLQAGSSKALGSGAFVVVFTQPLFWILLILIICGAVLFTFTCGGPK